MALAQGCVDSDQRQEHVDQHDAEDHRHDHLSDATEGCRERDQRENPPNQAEDDAEHEDGDEKRDHGSIGCARQAGRLSRIDQIATSRRAGVDVRLMRGSTDAADEERIRRSATATLRATCSAMTSRDADVVQLADTGALKAPPLWVRVPPSAPSFERTTNGGYCIVVWTSRKG